MTNKITFNVIYTLILVLFCLSGCVQPTPIMSSGEDSGREIAKYRYEFDKGYNDEMYKLANGDTPQKVLPLNSGVSCTNTLGNYPIALSSVSILLGILIHAIYISIKERNLRNELTKENTSSKT